MGQRSGTGRRRCRVSVARRHPTCIPLRAVVTRRTSRSRPAVHDGYHERAGWPARVKRRMRRVGAAPQHCRPTRPALPVPDGDFRRRWRWQGDPQPLPGWEPRAPAKGELPAAGHDSWAVAGASRGRAWSGPGIVDVEGGRASPRPSARNRVRSRDTWVGRAFAGLRGKYVGGAMGAQQINWHLALAVTPDRHRGVEEDFPCPV